MKKKVLLIGKNGQIGNFLKINLKLINNIVVKSISKKDLDLENLVSIKKKIK